MKCSVPRNFTTTIPNGNQVLKCLYSLHFSLILTNMYTQKYANWLYTVNAICNVVELMSTTTRLQQAPARSGQGLRGDPGHPYFSQWEGWPRPLCGGSHVETFTHSHPHILSQYLQHQYHKTVSHKKIQCTSFNSSIQKWCYSREKYMRKKDKVILIHNVGHVPFSYIGLCIKKESNNSL